MSWQNKEEEKKGCKERGMLVGAKEKRKQYDKLEQRLENATLKLQDAQKDLEADDGNSKKKNLR